MSNLSKTLNFEKELELYRRCNKRLFLKIKSLVEDLIKHPFIGKGKPERLKYKDPDIVMYSRRIDRKNRLIYRVISSVSGEDEIVLLSCKGHYGDH